jgi:hypothetical protein
MAGRIRCGTRVTVPAGSGSGSGLSAMDGRMDGWTAGGDGGLGDARPGTRRCLLSAVVVDAGLGYLHQTRLP